MVNVQFLATNTEEADLGPSQITLTEVSPESKAVTFSALNEELTKSLTYRIETLSVESKTLNPSLLRVL